ncbi:ligase-associated DNA damage response endonuclease PdeM [Croceimicrobium hydrocarbonivorans]|uniref:Ligase-associated DNA damage response endonuclease PdeM n=1 Tax=Croceimicrobium hydrocarbonivorans TaxID=2761580 RepID=A0A7H0VA64_9FLAO|nr:ligase-associated DNA damage response endonuclease PdeM [Croceimicrobium hydrocarbonivorans]QNR22612.1 ligase-associated DNA damage response endonuclease PdeM [Croceimicrobium hydrocarbonivorans]
MKELISISGEELWLLPERAIYWPDQRRLFIADTHFGKISHFRKNGIKLPEEAAKENLLRLERLLYATQAKEVYFLGDLFHSELNQEWLGFKQVIALFPSTEFHLIGGNHDILDEMSYYRARLKYHPEGLKLGPFFLSHEPLEEFEGYNLCGHIHPGVRLKGAGRQSLRLACYFFSPNQGILPAFGEFTGTFNLKVKKEDRVFVIAENRVIQIN